MRNERYGSLHYLRGMAAIAVVCFHILTQINTLGFNYAVWGDIGVDIFFVLSGFIMALLPQHDNISPREFLLRRIIRVVPLYWFVTLISIAIAVVKPELAKTVVVSLETVFKSLFFIPYQNYAHGSAYFPIVVPGWSLNFEMIFYLLLALSIFLSGFKYRWFVLLSVMCAFLMILNVVSSQEYFNFYYSYHLVEFLLGFVGACILRQWQKKPNSSIGFALLAVTVVLFILYIIYEIKLMVVPISLFLVCGLYGVEVSRGGFSNRILIALGDMSFSLYLCHVLVLSAVRTLYIRIYGEIDVVFYAVTCMVLSVGFAFYMWKYFEKPVSRYLLGITGLSRQLAK